MNTVGMRGVRPYTRSRIGASFDALDELLGPCTGLDDDAAYDVGSGAGFDTFALASRFRTVLALDPNWRAILEARAVARLRRASNVEFVRGDALDHVPERNFTFIHCNLMSHNVRSRVSLFHRLGEVAKPDCWLHYGEVTEGYPVMEICGAIASRNEVMLAERLRQALNGLLGRAGFRFFHSGTARAELECAGWRVERTTARDWQALTVTERIWARRERPPQRVPRPYARDPDYSVVPPALIELRTRVESMLERPNVIPVSIEIPASVSQHLVAASGFVAAVARALDEVPGTRPPALARLRRRLALRRKRSGTDWAALDELRRDFLHSVRAGRP